MIFFFVSFSFLFLISTVAIKRAFVVNALSALCSRRSGKDCEKARVHGREIDGGADGEGGSEDDHEDVVTHGLTPFVVLLFVVVFL